MNIPLVDLTSKNKTVQKKIFVKMKQVIEKGHYILGEDVTQFEKQFADYVGTKYCIGVASGTDALFLSLKALGIGKGDEVIIPTMTFISSVSAIIYTGAKPIFADISKEQPLIEPTSLEKKITRRTKVIIPVHLHGYPCNMTMVKTIAKKHNLTVLEDACQAHGSLYKNNKAGSLGDIASFSFYPSKNLGAYGDSGAVVTSDKKIYEMIIALRDHGQFKKYAHQIIGYNSRLDSLQAAILSIKLPLLDKMNKKRRRHADLYNKFLKNLPIQLPLESKDYKTNYHIYSIRTDKRDLLLTYLKNKGIFCGIHYPIPLHLQPALTFLGYKKGDFPNAEVFAAETLSLPMYPELTNKQIVYVCKEIKSFFK